MKTIAKTRILCTDQPKQPRHEVRRLEDGRYACDCGESAVVKARRIGALIRRGTRASRRRSCAGLIAFVDIGLPTLLAAGVDPTAAWDGWKNSWFLYQTNGLVREAVARLIAARDAPHADTLEAARRAILSCARYRDGMSAADFGREVAFIPEADIAVGATIALFSSDSWCVPLQKDWLETVGSVRPVIQGRFIVGVGPRSGVVYAIDGSNDDGFTVREFRVVDGRLAPLPSAAKSNAASFSAGT